MRTIYIDADACPVTHIAEEIARCHGIPVTILCDTNHVIYSDYSTVKLIGAGADGRGGACAGQGCAGCPPEREMLHGRQYRRTADGSSSGQKARRSGKHHLKGPAKRTEEDDRRFAESFEKLITELETL